MDVVTLGAALNGSAEYVNSHFKGGSNIQIVDNPDGTQTINASGEVSSEDTVARAEIAEMKDGENLDSFGDVETALADKANADNVYKLALTTDDLLPANTDLDNVKTVGCYYVYESVNVSTITHRPTGNTSAFRVTVELAAGKSRPRQIYQEFNSYDRYMRYETSSGTWANWKKVEGDLSTIYTKTEVDTALGNKADKSTTYTKTEVDTALNGKVDKETGKSLSTNDYTTTEKTKLAGIAEGAEVNEIEGIKVNGSTVNPDSNKVVSITIPTSAVDVSALPNTTKYAAALSLAINSSTFVMTGQLKDQNGDNLGTAQTIDLPLESVVVGGSYDSQTKKVILTLQNGNTIEFSVADLVSGLQTELSATNKLDPSFIDYDTTHAAVTESDKTTWSGKQDALTFDGTYSASTNKAATVSTVTNAVDALDVTGDASVSASKTISAWSETDGKVSISTQDIAIAGTQTTLTGYAKSGTAGQAVAATDNVNQAIGKLEATVDDNKNNISSIGAIIGKQVYSVFLGQDSGTAEYQMKTADFQTDTPNVQQCGIYIVYVISWSTTPVVSIYTVGYSGGTTGYNVVAKIVGTDSLISVDENRKITYTGKGKISIYAMR